MNAADKFGGKRTNWLLIKHRDEAAHEGDDDALLEGSDFGRLGPHDGGDRAGTGKAPKPFMTGEEACAPARSGKATRKAAATRPSLPETTAKAKKITAMPGFIAPQLAKLVEQPPSGHGWVHEIKFDGYRMQLRVEDGKATLRTRKGLDWTDKFPAIAERAEQLPDCIIDGEACALDDNGAPDFAALQAALVRRQTEDLIFFAFDLLFAEGEDLRAAAARPSARRG